MEKTRFLGSLYGHGQSYAGAVFDSEYLSPTLTTMQGGGREPHIIVSYKLDQLRIKLQAKEKIPIDAECI